MKYHHFILLIFISLVILFGCNTQKRMEYNTKRILQKSYNQADTVFQFSNYSMPIEILWFHTDSLIFAYIINPAKVIKLHPITMKTTQIDPKSIEQHFDFSFEKEDDCFQTMLDGTAISMHIINQPTKWSSVDIDCLLSKEYAPGSFDCMLKNSLSLIIKQYKEHSVD